MERQITKPEVFYQGAEGDAWMRRCDSSKYLKQNIAMFAKIIERTERVHSVLEFGPGGGNDLLALSCLLPGASFAGVEINALACETIKEQMPDVEIHHISAMDYQVTKRYDMVLCKGFLVHIIEEILPDIYRKIYDAADKYICLVEYYNPTPVEINWRDNQGVMFKRDFCGEMLNQFSDLKLADYGFVYHRDANFPQDDFNWFLMEKRG